MGLDTFLSETRTIRIGLLHRLGMICLSRYRSIKATFFSNYASSLSHEQKKKSNAPFYFQLSICTRLRPNNQLQVSLLLSLHLSIASATTRWKVRSLLSMARPTHPADNLLGPNASSTPPCLRVSPPSTPSSTATPPPSSPSVFPMFP